MQLAISPTRREEIAGYLSGRNGRVVRSGVGSTLLLLGLAVGPRAAIVLSPVGALVVMLALMNVCVLDRWIRRVSNDGGS